MIPLKLVPHPAGIPDALFGAVHMNDAQGRLVVSITVNVLPTSGVVGFNGLLTIDVATDPTPKPRLVDGNNQPIGSLPKMARRRYVVRPVSVPAYPTNIQAGQAVVCAAGLLLEDPEFPGLVCLPMKEKPDEEPEPAQNDKASVDSAIANRIPATRNGAGDVDQARP